MDTTVYRLEYVQYRARFSLILTCAALPVNQFEQIL